MAEDEGGGTVSISGARDVLGNLMALDTSYRITLIRGNLRIVSEPPLYAYAEAGGKYTFQVEVADAAGPVNYEWFKEDVTKEFVPVGPNAPVFTLYTLDFDDSGRYYCVITDSLSTAQTTPCLLQVIAQLPAGGLFTLGVIALLLSAAGTRLLSRR